MYVYSQGLLLETQTQDNHLLQLPVWPHLLLFNPLFSKLQLLFFPVLLLFHDSRHVPSAGPLLVFPMLGMLFLQISVWLSVLPHYVFAQLYLPRENSFLKKCSDIPHLQHTMSVLPFLFSPLKLST